MEQVSLPEPGNASGGASPEATPTPTTGPRRSPSRSTVEFLAVLLVGILCVRTFTAEAYIVPTGSMAPTLTGIHKQYTCPNCGMAFVVGVDEQGWSGRPVCPNCGQMGLQPELAPTGSGDRLLVHKYLFDLRNPRRWESAVFWNPEEPGQAYVKRIVGLPGESVLIHRGDIYIDGRIARKTPEEQRAMRILVYDNDFVPGDSARYPRWEFQRRGQGRFRRDYRASGWRPEGTGFLRPALDDGDPTDETVDWMDYLHWQPDRGGYGPVQDFLAYNSLELPAENRVDDLAVEATVSVDPTVGAVAVLIRHDGDHFLVTIPVQGSGRALQVRHNGRALPVTPGGPTIRPSTAEETREVTLEASVMDRRLTVLVDGELLFDPVDYDDPRPGHPYGMTASRPISLGVIGPGRVEVGPLRIYRDVFYTDALAGAPRPPFGVGEPYQLGDGEYFVLGDNSPVSNDSRFWAKSPVVRRESFLGKPFLVHLPCQVVPLQVFGREIYWIPDPRQIRYIR